MNGYVPTPTDPAHIKVDVTVYASPKTGHGRGKSIGPRPTEELTPEQVTPQKIKRNATSQSSATETEPATTKGRKYTTPFVSPEIARRERSPTPEKWRPEYGGKGPVLTKHVPEETATYEECEMKQRFIDHWKEVAEERETLERNNAFIEQQKFVMQMMKESTKK